jgi:hypothetical protein
MKLMTGLRDTFDALKSFGDLLIRFALIGVVLAAFFLPAFFAERLGGLREQLKANGFDFAVNVGGLSITEREVQEQLSQNTETLSHLSAQVVTLEGLLRCREAGNCSERQQAQLQDLLGGEPAVAAEVDETIRRNEALLAETARPRDEADGAAENRRWAVIAGSDLSLAGARYEAERIPEGRDTRIVRRGSYYVTLVLFDSRAQARDAVADIQEAVGRQPFVRDFADWCPAPQPGPEGIAVCDL